MEQRDCDGMVGNERKSGLRRRCKRLRVVSENDFCKLTNIDLWYWSRSYGVSLFKNLLSISNYLSQYFVVVYLGQFASTLFA
jgi:hypothetical protein